jgi:L-seryl-tRNA(Ser) seleniumtransferase
MSKPALHSWRPPSIDALLRATEGQDLITVYGRKAATEELRAAVDFCRTNNEGNEEQIFGSAALALAKRKVKSIKPVINLTGSVLHTNLGRAPLSDAALSAMNNAAGFINLEYDLKRGARGERDSHVATWLMRLTGAEAGIAVNNNAAAVMAVLNSLSRGKEAIISRGELVEIGGSFRMPEVMARAGVKLREVGATNRTHLSDYANAISNKTGIIVRVRPSNFAIQGFTSSVAEKDLAALAHEHGIPFYDELGAGALVDLRRWGLPYERTVQEALLDGADIVSFSGDKLMGGPQAGLIVGRKDLVAKISRNPLKRAIRLDKITLAALEATLALYDNDETLAENLPTFRYLSRKGPEIREIAETLAAVLSSYVPEWKVEVASCKSQIGSGALPVDVLDSFAVTFQHRNSSTKASGGKLKKLALQFRNLPTPVIGRIHEEKFWLDCRCLDNVSAIKANVDRSNFK